MPGRMTARMRMAAFRSGVIAVAAWLLLLPSPALAQGLPDRPITLVSGFAPGGSTDLVARTVKAHLEKQLGAPVVIVNQTAGGGGVATNAVATAKPDGGTFLLFHALLHTAHLFGRSPLSFRDFTPIATISEVNNVLAVKKSAPYSTLAELLSYVKANPGKLKLASQLGGTTQVIGQATAKWLQNTVVPACTARVYGLMLRRSRFALFRSTPLAWIFRQQRCVMLLIHV